MSVVGENRYGKSRVRLMRVNRTGEMHRVREWTLQILLRGDFDECFSEGDNSKILPTDTMKNTVYSLARKSTAGCIEDFAAELIDFFLGRNPQVASAEVSVSQKAWEHLDTNGKPHPSAFVQSSGERQTAKVSRARGGQLSIVSGLDNLIVMKTANSGFEGYIRDSLTTLPPTSDRLFATAVRAEWSYLPEKVDFEKLRGHIRAVLLDSFAAHESKSVQHTLYAMGDAVLSKIPDVAEIELAMPNIHYLLVDLSRFGQDNPNEVFLPTDEPHGYIEARIQREK
ncbi:MAG TPA: urate oxidase [Candidatus Aquilonibacter sp.]|nr:urate oxidase [Candidatus Aquilonibacter sp.]